MALVNDIKTLNEELSNKKLVALTQKQIDLLYCLTGYVAFRAGEDYELYTDFVNLSETLESLTTDVNKFDLVELVLDEDPLYSEFRLK